MQKTQKSGKTILGIVAFYHDSSVALIHNHKVICLSEEERFNLQKHTKALPVNSLHYCLQKAGIKIEEIDEIAYYFNPWLCLVQYLIKNNPLSIIYDFKRWKQLRFWNEMVWLVEFWRNIKSLKKSLKASNAKVHYIPHTTCHLFYGLYCMPDEAGTVLVNDSMGEYTGVQANEFRSRFDEFGNRYNIISKKLFVNSDPNSIGYFYGAITKYMGFKTGHHEGKVMALASYFNSKTDSKLYNLIKKNIILNKNGTFRFSKKILVERGYGIHSQRLGDYLLKKLGDSDFELSNIKQKHFEWSSAFQKCTNDLIAHQVNSIIKKSNYRVIVHVGGVAQNSVANGYISNRYPNILFHVPPVPYDAGCSLGAALYLHNKLYNYLPPMLETAFMGYNEDLKQVINKLQLYNINFESINNEKQIIDLICKKLKQGCIIAIMDEEMECGPRALGHRSILADPSLPYMRSYLNDVIKMREWYRPYGGIILEERLKDILEVKNHHPSSDYMSFVYKVKKEWKNKIPALVHVDDSCRVQIIRKELQPFIYDLLKRYEELNELPVLINTSFNVRSLPICRTTEDAIATFYTSALDMLIINKKIIIYKNKLVKNEKH